MRAPWALGHWPTAPLTQTATWLDGISLGVPIAWRRADELSRTRSAPFSFVVPTRLLPANTPTPPAGPDLPLVNRTTFTVNASPGSADAGARSRSSRGPED